jgi:hypothetical protein
MYIIVGTIILVSSLLLMPAAQAQLPSRRARRCRGWAVGVRVGSSLRGGWLKSPKWYDHAVLRTGKQDGYFGNQLIKILLPDSLQTVEPGLRLAGFGPQVDEFVLSMNRAAEKAAPKAKEIFVGAITSMTIDDATKILNGGDTSATDFFKRKTSTSLYKEFRPIIDNTMNQVGTVQKYNKGVGRGRQDCRL